MKKTLLCVLFCLMGCFFLSACGNPKVPEPYGILSPTKALYERLDLLTPQATKSQASTSGQVEYCIVVDDGLGMKGFVSPFCMSYRAAITAAMSVTISDEHTCLRASDVEKGTEGSEHSTDTFFQNAVQEQFFQKESNDIASVITSMAESYQQNPDQVMILISDLMIPTEDDCMKAAEALRTSVIAPEHATLGLIGIVGDFRGTIENLPVSPTTGHIRKLSDYMVLERDENGNFRHPLYLMFMGNDQAVLNAMEKAMISLKNSGLLDETTPYHALYFSEYDVSRRAKDDIFSTFHLGCQPYNNADYPVEYLVRGIENEKGKIDYPAGTEVTNEYQQLLKTIPIVKLYDLERGNTEKNVKIRCTVPFTLVDSSQNGIQISDPFNLVVPAKKFALSQDDYTVTADIRVLNDAQSAPSWVEPESSLVYCESATIDKSGKKIELVLSVDTCQLVKDEPLLCTVGIRVTATPELAELSALYDTKWVEDLTLNLKDFDRESISQGQAITSARFTYATTAKTPFLSSLICGGIANQQIQIIGDAIQEKTAACVQTTMFGMVVRDVPGKYLSTGTWKETDDFGGWAFSINDATQIQAAIN